MEKPPQSLQSNQKNVRRRHHDISRLAKMEGKLVSESNREINHKPALGTTSDISGRAS